MGRFSEGRKSQKTCQCLHDHLFWGKRDVAQRTCCINRLPLLFHLEKQPIMKKFMYLILAVMITTSAFSQAYVSRVLVLNEGYFDYITNDIIVPVTVGAYDPQTDTYTTIQTIDEARFASDIAIDGDYYYVAADHFLQKYDLLTNALISSIDVEGIRQIAITNDEIIVTRGEYLVTLPSYIQVYQKETMTLDYEIPADVIPHTTEGVIVKDGKAYIAVNNGFVFGGEVGYIAVLDLATAYVENIIDLGADGINPDNLMIEGDQLFTLNNKDFTGSSVSSYKIGTGELATTNLANISSGCGTSAISGGSIYYQELFGTTISKFDPETETITDENEYGISFYGLSFDPLNGQMYTSETDYFSYGKVYVYNTDGTLSTSFDAGVSPGNFAFDVRMESGVKDLKSDFLKMQPNPATEQISLKADFNIETVSISNIQGASCLTLDGSHADLMLIDITKLPAGQYILSATGDSSTQSAMFIKQ